MGRTGPPASAVGRRRMVDRVWAESPGRRGQQSDSCGSWRTSRCRNPWSLGPALPRDRPELAAQLAARHALLRLSGKRAQDRRGHEADGDRARLCGRNRRSFARPPVSSHRHLTGLGAQTVAVRGGRLHRQISKCGDRRVRTLLYETATFLAALRNDRMDAPSLFDGPINGERFKAYVEQFLARPLSRVTS